MTNQDLFVYQSPADLGAFAKEIVATPTEESWPTVTVTYPRNSAGCSFEKFTGPKDHVFAMVAFVIDNDRAEFDYMHETLDYCALNGDNAVVILSRCHIVR